MTTRISALLCLLCAILSASTTFSGEDCLVTPSSWPPNAYELLRVTLRFTSDDLEPRAVYCDLRLPSGRTIGTYATDIDENGVGIFSFATTTLSHYDEEGIFLLDNLRILTPDGFASIPGAYATQEYTIGQFRPICQSTLLSRDNGLLVNLGEYTATIGFTCPSKSTSLPEFLFRENTVFDGYAIGIDTLLEDISFDEIPARLFNTPTYRGYDATETAKTYLLTQGDGDKNLDPDESLVLQAGIQWNGNDFGTDSPEDFIYLILFYHDANQDFVDTDAVVVHPFDTNANLQLTKSELDGGQELWINGKTSPQFLLEAIDLCDATTYEYDYYTDRYYPYYP